MGKDRPNSEVQELEVAFKTQRVCRASCGLMPPDALWEEEKTCSSSLQLVWGVLTRDKETG